MDREEFYKAVKEMVPKYLDQAYAGHQVVIKEFHEAEGTKHCLALVDAKPGLNRIPALDLEHYYQMVKGGRNLENVIKQVTAHYTFVYEQTQRDRQVVTEVTGVKMSEFLEHLHTAVWNFEKNKDTLKNIPYQKFHDLAVVPMAFLPGGEDVVLTRSHAAQLGFSEGELLQKAMENNVKICPPRICSLGMVEFLGWRDLNEMKPLEKKGQSLVLSNDIKKFGASLITDKEVMRKISEVLGDDFFILPSSTDEVIIMPRNNDMGMNPKEIKTHMEDMATNSEVKDAALSKNIYEYDREKQVVKTFDGKTPPEKGTKGQDER